MWHATVSGLGNFTFISVKFNFVSIGLRHLTGRKLMADERCRRERHFQLTSLEFSLRKTEHCCVIF